MSKIKPKSLHLISLGCAKNTVDSDSMRQLLERAGYRLCEHPRQAEVIVVNTCGFIGPAKAESLKVLNEMAGLKRPGQLLVAAGCLSQRYGAGLAQAVPGLDGVLGTRRWMEIVEVVERLRGQRTPAPLYHLPGDAVTVGNDEHGALRAAVQGASAYLKMADGCRRPCAFCAIPLIKGTAVSRPPAAIAGEARALAAQGCRELVLIAQDTTDYGTDLGLTDGLPDLLDQITQAAPELSWLRVMYAYPGSLSPRLIERMAALPQVLHYLDLPLQHAHPDTLRRMRRPANTGRVRETLAHMRAAMPDLALRSTFIVGYPGETEAEFQTLLDFVEETQFDRVGVFTFSPEEDTPAAALDHPVPEPVKEERRARLMELQQRISLQKNEAWVGRTLEVLMEGEGEGLSVGRSYRDAPEIDGLVIVEGQAPLGQIVPVTITGAMVYDLAGRLAGHAPGQPKEQG